MAVVEKEFADPRLKRLFDYWNGKRRHGVAPSREAIDPLEIPSLLPIINLIDVERDPLRFRHRLVGTELVDKLGRDVTGRTVDASLYGESAAEVFGTLRRITEEARPFRRLSRLDWHGRSWQSMEALELPLLDASGRVCRILRGATFGVIQPPLPQRLVFEPLELD